MISKELLSEICQTNLMSLGKLEVVGSDICLYDCSMQPDIYMCWNIYELAHKCKEWASINSYALESSVHMQPKRNSVAGCQIHWRYETEDLPYFEADTEVEAIFKACQWILDKDSK